MLTPTATAVAAAVFVAVVSIARYVSLASVIAALALPIVSYAAGAPSATVASAISVVALVVYRHRANLARLRSGTERRVVWKGTDMTDGPGDARPRRAGSRSTGRPPRDVNR